jgi:soluble lytic murein transglycosylase-like protein/TolA-binding protein
LTPRSFYPLALLVLFLAGCVAATTDQATPGAGDSSTAGAAGPGTPAATATVSLTPRAGSAPGDPAQARRLEAGGELQPALDAYLAIAASSGPDKAEGVFGAARVLLQMDRPADARTLLEPFIAAGGPNTPAPAHYLLARAYTALSMYTEAVGQYDLYIQSGRPATPYAYLDKARILMDQGQPQQAASDAQVGLSAGLPVSSRRTFTLITAQSYEKAGDFANALAWYQRLFDQSPGDQPLALSRMAAIKQAQGADNSAEQTTLMLQYPTSQQALDTLSDLLAKGRSVDPYIRGLVYYRHNDYEKAEPAFQERIKAAPDDASSADAYYFEAAIQESRANVDEAKADYAKVAALNPASSLADDALWWRGRLLEAEGNLADARAAYSRIVTDYTSSSWAPDAAFRLGELDYHAGNFRDAAAAWAQSAATATGSQRQRLTFWQGKALLMAGDKAAAEAVLKPLAASGEDDYYGVRAAAVLKGDHGHPKADRDPKANLTPDFDWAAAEAWLAAKAGRPVTPPTSQTWYADPRWLRAQELWLVGRDGQAAAEAFDLIDFNAQDAIAMYTMARGLRDLGQSSLSARAGQRLLRVLNTNPNEGLPKALLSLSYPAPFAASVKKYADAEKISPLLMLAFIRQESFFDPSAQSGAPAYGLTQLLAATARSVAQKLGLGEVKADDLFGADLNLRLGANYMAAQLKDFDNDIFVAFAAYNAGPDAARRWAKAAGDDADLFLETVEFSETRLYVQNVAENYAIYRYLYGGQDLPSLPGD